MRLGTAVIGSGVLFFLANAGASAQTVPPGSRWPTTSSIGSNFPLIGDTLTASKLCKKANAAADAGSLSEAKSDFQSAIAAAPLYEDAIIGLARCDAAEGNFAASIDGYEKIVSGSNERYDINLLTEYALVLIEAGSSRKAIGAYNHVVDLVKEGRAVTKMEVALPIFRTAGSDTGLHYSPDRMQAMIHLIRAMNASYSDHERIDSEMDLAVSQSPRSAALCFYQGVFLSRNDTAQAEALSAFQQALALDDGSNKQIIQKRIAAFGPVEPASAAKR